MSNIKDLTGQKIGDLLLLDRERKNNRTYYFCRCACGNEKWIRADSLNRSGNCGCKSIKQHSRLIGQKFGGLTAIKSVGVSKNNGVIWLCKCECGNTTEVTACNLTRGAIKSCGCLQAEKAKETVKKAFGEFKSKNLYAGTNIASLGRVKLLKNNKSGVNGVTFNTRTQKWIATIGFQNQRFFLGSYSKKEDAIKVREEATEKIHGEFLSWYNKLPKM